jgi:chemotaxis-related protein WspD
MSSPGDHLLAGHDCWNSIGVRGDQSCVKLATHIHCRNCEVYAEAAQRNLQRPVDAAYRAAWAAELRQPLAVRSDTDAAALVFRIGAEWLALPTAMVVQVAPLAPVHRLPHRTTEALLGVVNAGGKLMPAIALGQLLGIDAGAAPPVRGRQTFARLLIIRSDGQQFALPVADLDDIVHYRRAALHLPAATINQGLTHYLRGVLAHRDLRVGLLDPAQLGPALARMLR